MTPHWTKPFALTSSSVAADAAEAANPSAAAPRMTVTMFFIPTDPFLFCSGIRSCFSVRAQHRVPAHSATRTRRRRAASHSRTASKAIIPVRSSENDRIAQSLEIIGKCELQPEVARKLPGNAIRRRELPNAAANVASGAIASGRAGRPRAAVGDRSRRSAHYGFALHAEATGIADATTNHGHQHAAGPCRATTRATIFGFVNPPVVHASTVLFPDAATMAARSAEIHLRHARHADHRRACAAPSTHWKARPARSSCRPALPPSPCRCSPSCRPATMC